MSSELEKLLREVEILEEKARALGMAAGRPGSIEGAVALASNYSQWRYENPGKARAVRCGVALVLLVVAVLGAWLLAGTGVGQVTGLAAARDRVSSAYYAVLWSTRSTEGAVGTDIQPVSLSCSIEQVVGDVLIVSCYENGQRLRRLVKLANVIVKDKEAFAAWANQYLLKGVGLDFYRPIDKVSGHEVWGVVLWYRRAPLNVETVEQGIALPEKNPPTTVVNQIFAQYYWGLAKNGRAN